MTTAHTPKLGESMSKSHRSELGSSNTPVLIRLPYLGDDRAEVPQPEPVAFLRESDYGLEGSNREDIAPVAAPQPPAPLSSPTSEDSPSRGTRKRIAMWKVFKRWSLGKLPRPAIQGVIGVAMITLCVLVYVLLFGRGPQEQPMAKGDPPAEETLAGFDTGPSLDEALDLPGEPHLPREPYLPLETITSIPSETPESTLSPAAPESSLAVASADPSADSEAGEPQTDEIGMESTGSAESQLEEGIAATDVTPSAETATEPSPAPTPPTPVAESSAAEAVVVKYPQTNPATFQYPPEYHRHLQPDAATARSSSWPADASENVWPSSTARLQPQIDPPPVR